MILNSRVMKLLTGVCLVLVAGAVWGQRSRWRGYDSTDISDRQGVPEWTNDEKFADDVFTFARIRYDSNHGYRRGGGWRTDFPTSDLNFSLRLQQL
ncbi:MAG: hypothetical protein AB8B91_14160, partial [Rubripirellula sp.]